MQYGEAEKEILMIVSQQIAAAIESKRSEAAIRESENKFSAVAETSPTLILVSDGNRIFYANPAAEAGSGYTREELLRMDPWTLIRGGLSAPRCGDGREPCCMVKRRPADTSFRLSPRAARNAGWASWPGTSSTGARPRSWASAEDITERKRAEQLQSALYRVSEQAAAAEDLPQFFASLHAIVGELMFARNFYIALYGRGIRNRELSVFCGRRRRNTHPQEAGQGPDRVRAAQRRATAGFA